MKHGPTDSYFHLARRLAECMMRDDNLNMHIEHVRMELTDTEQILISHVCDSNERESKGVTVAENYLQVCSIDNSESGSTPPWQGL